VGNRDAAASDGPLAQAELRNRILRSMPAREFARIESALEAVPLVADQILFDPRLASSRAAVPRDSLSHSHFYFPEESVLSLVCCPVNDAVIELGVIGPEGFVTAPPVLGLGPGVTRYIVQGPGRAIRVQADVLVEAMARDGRLRSAIDRFVQSLVDQIAIAAACNVGHSPQHRCARWMLMIHDRVDGDEFGVTQEFLAYMLGMSRQTVSGVARELQRAGLIDYTRGRVRITNRAGLETAACHCYQASRKHAERLFVK
jgi:CRP-like cAMP-binding protein